MHTENLSEQDFVWLVGSLCQIERVPLDPALLLNQCLPPHDLASLRRALDGLGMAAKDFRVTARNLKRLAPPFVAFLKTPTGEGSLDPALVTTVLIVRADAERLLCFHPGEQAPQTLSAAEFLERFEPDVLQVRARPSAQANTDEADPGAPALLNKPFGFRWFVPELMGTSNNPRFSMNSATERCP